MHNFRIKKVKYSLLCPNIHVSVLIQIKEVLDWTSGVMRRRYSVFIHSVDARRRTSDSRTYFIWRMTETWMFGHNNQQQNNFKLHFNLI